MARQSSATDGAGTSRERLERADSSVVWFAEECSRNGVTLEGCIHCAQRSGDLALVAFFRRAQLEASKLGGTPRPSVG